MYERQEQSNKIKNNYAELDFYAKQIRMKNFKKIILANEVEASGGNITDNEAVWSAF